MSGFAGVWTFDSEFPNKSILKQMSSTIAHRGPDGETFYIENDFGVAFQQMRITPEEMQETQPIVDPRGYVLVLDGRLDNRQELLTHLAGEVKKSDSDAQFILAAYAKWGESFAEKLLGEYAFALFDKKMQHLLLVRDVVGVRPLYYYHSSKFCAFGSEIKTLLAHPRIPCQPSDEGLAEYLIGHTQHNLSLTCYDGIFAVEPSQMIKFTKKEIQKKIYWDFDYKKKTIYSSVEEYSAAFYELYKQAVERRIRSAYPVGFSVSGGLDSSTIFALAKTLEEEGRATAPFIGLTYFGEEHTRSDELSYLALLEKKYGISMDRLSMSPYLSLTEGIDEQVTQIEAPFVDASWELSKVADKMVSERGARVVVSGHWGDQLLFPQAYLRDLAKSFKWKTISRHFKEFPNWFVGDEINYLKGEFGKSLIKSYAPQIMLPLFKKIKRTLFSPGKNLSFYTKEFVGTNRKWVSAWEKWPQPFHSEHAREIYYEVRKKYCVLCLEWNNKMGAFNQLEYVYPMMDRDLISFLMAIPGEIINLNGVPRGLLRHSMAKILPQEIAQRNWKADFSDPVNEGVNKEIEIISRQLSKDSLIVKQGYVDAQELKKEVELAKTSVERENCELSWAIAELYGFEHWLRIFSKGEKNEKKEDRAKKEKIQDTTA